MRAGTSESRVDAQTAGRFDASHALSELGAMTGMVQISPISPFQNQLSSAHLARGLEADLGRLKARTYGLL